MLEWNSKVTDEAWMFWHSYGGQKGFEVKEKGTQTKKNLIANLHHVDMIVEMRVIEEKTK